MQGAAGDAEAAHLPEQQQTADVELPAVDEEVGGLVALGAVGGGVDAQVRVETVLGRDAGEHRRLQPLLPGLPDGGAGGVAEHPGVPVKHGAHRLAGPRRRQQAVHDGGGDRARRPVRRVEVEQRLDAGIQRLDAAGELRRQLVENAVGAGDRVPDLRGEMRRPDAGARHRQAPGRRPAEQEPDLPLVPAADGGLLGGAQAGLRHRAGRVSLEGCPHIGVFRQVDEKISQPLVHPSALRFEVVRQEVSPMLAPKAAHCNRSAVSRCGTIHPIPTGHGGADEDR